MYKIEKNNKQKIKNLYTKEPIQIKIVDFVHENKTINVGIKYFTKIINLLINNDLSIKK